VNATLPGGLFGEAIARAVGDELRRVRERRGLSRLELVGTLPSGIGDRTVLSYEHGKRQMTLYRLAEMSWALDVDASKVFARGLQRARLLTETLTLAVDLRALLRDDRVQFRVLAQWARNMLNDNPSGVVEVEPEVVRHLASFIGCKPSELAAHFARFLPGFEACERSTHTSSK
jgi:transcriptional regulator with XRE-family HTH domain